MGKGEGRGEGKGGCNVIDGFAEFGRQVVCCACCLVTLGPILTIVGIVFLALSVEDPRDDKVSDYNAVVKNWQDQNYGLFKDAYCPGDDTATCGFRVSVKSAGYYGSILSQEELSKTTSVTSLVDDGGDLHDYSETLWFTNSVRYDLATGNTVDITLTDRDNIHEYYGVAAVKCQKKTWQESSSSKSSSSSKKRKYTYSRLEWHQLTSATFVAECTASSCAPRSTPAADAEDSCNGYKYELLSAGGTYSCDGCALGTIDCTYEEESQYTSSEITTTFSVRSSEDPYVDAGDETGCDYDFGLSATELLSVGIGCLVCGLAYTGAMMQDLSDRVVVAEAACVKARRPDGSHRSERWIPPGTSHLLVHAKIPNPSREGAEQKGAWRTAGASSEVLQWISKGARMRWIDNPPQPFDYGVSLEDATNPEPVEWAHNLTEPNMRTASPRLLPLCLGGSAEPEACSAGLLRG
ncbi:hypothetical protein CYMTET_44887 [Cymbomonas tetramitiformis]|uniref:Uncharacterized protein n=1 Tax=Cymbomonas tetramitiformis TaxID=36881 RepID=A0AAE0BZC5_9CHLO|nr:hypothetical protein CYMTET_44887 [Cymbomonas tetramitiformis]